MSNLICEIAELNNNKKIGELVPDKSRYVIAKCKDTNANKSKYMTINNTNNYKYIPSQQNLQVIQFKSLYQLGTSDIEEINILGEDVKYSIIYKKTILVVLYSNSFPIYYILYRDDERKILIIEKDLQKFNAYLHKSITNINIKDDICIAKLDHEKYYKYKENINNNLLYAYIYNILNKCIKNSCMNNLDKIIDISSYLLEQIKYNKNTKIGDSFNVLVIKNEYNIKKSVKNNMTDKFEKLLYDCTDDIDMFINLDKKVNYKKVNYNNYNITKYTHPVKKLYIFIKSDNIYIFILKLDGYINKESYKKLFLVKYDNVLIQSFINKLNLKLKLVPTNY